MASTVPTARIEGFFKFINVLKKYWERVEGFWGETIQHGRLGAARENRQQARWYVAEYVRDALKLLLQGKHMVRMVTYLVSIRSFRMDTIYFALSIA